METAEATMNIGEIAQYFVQWRNEGDGNKIRMELYSADIESIEEGFDNEIGRVTGMSGLGKKGQGLKKQFEVYNIKASDPVIADNWFSIKFEIDSTDKKSGKRSTLSEIGVFKVKGGKIVKEHYFMF